MKQFKLAVAVLASTTLFSSASFAFVSFKDDLMPVSASAPYNWTGAYIGGNLGAVKSTMNITDIEANYFYATLQETTNPKFTGGFQIGYRKQIELNPISGVYGIEFSTDFSNAQYSKQLGSGFALYQLSADNKLQNIFLLQLIGGIAANRTLLFVAAGLSWANINGDVTSLDGVPFANTFNVGKEVQGTALGAGIEYAFSEKLSVRFKVDVITPNVYTTYDTNNAPYQITNNIVQGTFGLNYKFG